MPTPTASTPTTASTLSGNATVDSLLGATRWAGNEISFSFGRVGSVWSTATGDYRASTGSGEPWNGYAVLNTAQQSAVRDALASWSAAAAVNFVEIGESPTAVGTVRFAFSTATALSGLQAEAYGPGAGARAGDVWFNGNGSSAAATSWYKGSYEYVTALHEIGHTLGLRHPSEGSKPIANALDSRSFTVMSDAAAPGRADTWFSFEPTTPMVLDVAALAQLYGPNTATNTGNTTYRYSGTGIYHHTLVDAGGIDTIVYTSSGSGRIDLTPGVTGGSRLGEAVFVQDASHPNLARVNNVWIADRTVIEHATGGNGNDTLIGNTASNLLRGQAGNDSISGGAGNDTLNGETGQDTMVGGDGSDTYYVDTALDVVTETGRVTSTLDRINTSINWTLDRIGSYSIEQVRLLGTATKATGNTLSNTLYGNELANPLSGAAGNDTLFGSLGSDTLTGGAGHDDLDGGSGIDRLVGGDGSDTYRVDNIGDVVDESGTLDSALDTVVSSVSWSLSSAGNLVIEGLTLGGTTAIDGTGNAQANTLTGNGAANRLSGGDGADTLSGGAGNDVLVGGGGPDRLTGGTGADAFLLDNGSGPDTLTDFVSRTDTLRIQMSTLGIGDRDAVVEGAVTRAAAGGFSTAAELVVFTANAAGLTTTAAAAAIGSATSAYAVGRTALFVVDDGTSTGLFRFTSSAANAQVSAAELVLLATLSGSPAVSTADFLFSP